MTRKELEEKLLQRKINKEKEEENDKIFINEIGSSTPVNGFGVNGSHGGKMDWNIDILKIAIGENSMFEYNEETEESYLKKSYVKKFNLLASKIDHIVHYPSWGYDDSWLSDMGFGVGDYYPISSDKAGISVITGSDRSVGITGGRILDVKLDNNGKVIEVTDQIPDEEWKMFDKEGMEEKAEWQKMIEKIKAL